MKRWGIAGVAIIAMSVSLYIADELWPGIFAARVPKADAIRVIKSE